MHKWLSSTIIALDVSLQPQPGQSAREAQQLKCRQILGFVELLPNLPHIVSA